jgi:Flp pilus assembly protein TadD
MTNGTKRFKFTNRARLAQRIACVALVAGSTLLSVGVHAQSPSEVPEALRDGKAAFDAGDFEQAVRSLNAALPALGASDQRQWRIWTYEHLGWAKANLRDEEGARQEFAEIFRLDATYQPSPEMSPATQELVDQVRHAVVGDLAVSVDPPDARALLDGTEIKTGVAIPVSQGTHQLSASRPGYKSEMEAIVVNPGNLQESNVRLTRTSAVIHVQTKPPSVEVWLHSSTDATFKNVGTTDSGGLLLIDGIGVGEYRLELRRPCYKTRVSVIHVAELSDLELKTPQLDPAVGTLSITAAAPGAQAFLDRQPKGTAPVRLAGVCEGTHDVLIESPVGRYSKTVNVAAGATLDVTAFLRPSIGIIQVAAATGDDLARAAARALGASKSLDFVLPSPGPLPPAPDLLGDPSGLPESIGRRRGEQTAALAEALHTQAVAVVSLNANDNEIIDARIYARGSGQPDIMTFSALQDASPTELLRQMDRPLQLFRRTAGVFAVDVMNRPHPVVAAVTPANAGVTIGAQITSLNGKPVTSASLVNDMVGIPASASTVQLGVLTGTGVEKTVELPVVREATLVAQDDQSIFVNELLITLQCLAETTTDPEERQVANLNAGVLLMRLGQWQRAVDLLQQVDLSAGPGVSRGTVAYLRGLCYEQLGERDKAVEMWRAAKDAGGRLTEDGADISALAAAKLK